MTTQEAYERIRAWFTRPGAQLAKSSNPDGPSCLYRGRRNGRVLKCAVGCLIPKGLYDPVFEGKKIGALLGVSDDVPGFDDPALIDLFEGVDSGFLSEAQKRHDVYCDTVVEFVQSLDALAEKFELEVVS